MVASVAMAMAGMEIADCIAAGTSVVTAAGRTRDIATLDGNMHHPGIARSTSSRVGRDSGLRAAPVGPSAAIPLSCKVP